MKRLPVYFIVLALFVAACGDDDDSQSTIIPTTAGGAASTTTAAATTTTSDSATTQPTTTVVGEVRDEKRDPGDVKLLSVGKATGTDRSANAQARLEAVLAQQQEARRRGSDPYLDGLWDQCADGDMAACDELYQVSPVGSDYEAFGDTCGNLTQGGIWCVDLGATGIDDYGDDPYLDGLWDDCALGDWAACDALYAESPGGSIYEAFGATCGDVTDGSEWCVDVYGADTAYLDTLWDACAVGDWEACDELYVTSPLGSDYEAFGFTCGDLTDGSRWCVDEFGEGGQGYGEDPYLDGLWDDCAVGDMAACDSLYLESPVGSEYEAFGATCGDRTDGSEWCADTTMEDAFGYGDDPYFDGLWDQCAVGDMSACDTLYAESPLGSGYEAFGATCGGTTDGSEWCAEVPGGFQAGEPFTYGDDAYFDGLWDACAAGDWQACDDLYLESPVGSEYEDFGNTCGWITDGTMWCTDVYVEY